MKLEDIYNELEKSVEKAEGDLMRFVEKDLDGLELDDNGNILYSEKNIAIIYNIETTLQNLAFANNKVFKKLVTDMLRMTDGIKGDYNTTPQNLKNIKFKVEQLFYKMGYDANGTIIPGSYFDNISSFKGVSQQIADILLKGIANGISFDLILKEMRAFVMGAKGVDGVLKRYLRQEVHDTIWKTNAVINKYFADELGLKYFVYSGSIMDTTREFCAERNNYVFHVNDVASFPDNLPYFPPKYNFFIDRGGYNCRHKIRYLSNQLGARLWGKQLAA